MLTKGDGTDKDLDKSKEYLEASKTKQKVFLITKKDFLLLNYLASTFLLLLRMKLNTIQRKIAPTNAANAIQPSVGSSNDKNGSPSDAVKMQSMSHISVEEPNVIVKISRCNDFLSLKKNHKTPVIMVHAKVVKKYII